ncbi:ROK family protein [Brucella pituitosa]
MAGFKEIFDDHESPVGKILRTVASLGSASATDLVKKTGLARSTVSTILTELKIKEVVLETESRSSGFGRPTKIISLNPSQAYCAGVLFGLAEIRIAVCDLGHNVIADIWFEMREDYTPQEAMICVRDQLAVECAKLNIAIRDLLGVGLAISAPVSYEGTVLNGSILPTWCGIDIADIFSAHIDCPLFAENESHCGALAEMTWGAAIGLSNFVLYKFDLGIGGAIVIDGIVQRGAYGNAAEFGHISLNPHGPLCKCGNRGCLETYAGGFNLMQMAEQATGEKITFDDFIRHAQTGVLPYDRLIQDSAEMAGWAIGITSTILSPPDIIIAGKIAAIGPSFLRSVEQSFEKHAVRPPTHAPHVRKPNFIIGKFLRNDDTVLGAVALVLHQHGLISDRSKA